MLDTAIDLILHLLCSFFAGFVAWRMYGGGRKALYTALFWGTVGGFWIDLDHLIDYFLAYGLQFDLIAFLTSQQFDASGKVYVLFHAWEYLAVLAIAFVLVKKTRTKMIIFSVFVGVLLHLLVDALLFAIPFEQYSIVYRFLTGFRSLH